MKQIFLWFVLLNKRLARRISFWLILAAVPLLVMSILFILAPGLTGSTSMMIIPSGALAIGLAWLEYRRHRKEGRA